MATLPLFKGAYPFGKSNYPTLTGHQKVSYLAPTGLMLRPINFLHPRSPAADAESPLFTDPTASGIVGVSDTTPPPSSKPTFPGAGVVNDNTPGVIVIDNGQHGQVTYYIAKEYAPGSNIDGTLIQFPNFSKRTQLNWSDPTQINAYIDAESAMPGDLANDIITDAAQNPNDHSINISMSYDRERVYGDLYLGYILAPNSALPDLNQLYGIGPNASDQQVRAAIVQYADNRMLQSGSVLSKGLQAWQDATASLAAKGTIVTVAYGNDHDPSHAFQSQSPDQEVNWLAMSHNVISVGASTTNDANGQPASFESEASPNSPWTPTVSVKGVGVNVPNTPYTNEQGTSFSAPAIAGYIADLEGASTTPVSFTQIQNILTDPKNIALKASPSQRGQLGTGIFDIYGKMSSLYPSGAAAWHNP